MFGHKHRRRMVQNKIPYSGYSYPYPSGHSQSNQNNYMYYPNQGFYGMPNQASQLPSYGQPNMQQPFFMPYPKSMQQSAPKPPQGGMQSILAQFKTKEGGYDFNKMVNTAGQMMNTVNQLNGMVKQVGALFKTKV
ncbi:YppG family protein [Bacillus salitolerans]|uniref:YppG family protein n=1 Tax=Bacillus salitolerans TaxID=1437434 RepID=A0ABW4LTP5_9BACI